MVLTFNNLVALKRTMADLCGLDLGPGSTGLDLSPGSAGERNTESHSVVFELLEYKQIIF